MVCCALSKDRRNGESAICSEPMSAPKPISPMESNVKRFSRLKTSTTSPDATSSSICTTLVEFLSTTFQMWFLNLFAVNILEEVFLWLCHKGPSALKIPLPKRSAKRACSKSPLGKLSKCVLQMYSTFLGSIVKTNAGCKGRSMKKSSPKALWYSERASWIR